ncbi:hypothetical protein PENSTE_c005G04965 [Penicillium steckii]|uniref:Isochorismatase-like domain-containing protein n=1 Tax=Penicillium steckii TaxID=303698 RepID=A0A1V6TLF4_9EURO|nr:hypothetical protein PENSTE_c005G04965 [Penicillium steckii]
MTRLVTEARKLGIPIFYGLHQPYKEGNYYGWKHLTKSHHRIKRLEAFQEGSWGSEIYTSLLPDTGSGDVVVSRHWNSRGYRVTLIKDATAGFSKQLKDAATDLVWPTLVEDVLTVDQWTSLQKKKDASL